GVHQRGQGLVRGRRRAEAPGQGLPAENYLGQRIVRAGDGVRGERREVFEGAAGLVGPRQGVFRLRRRPGRVWGEEVVLRLDGLGQGAQLLLRQPQQQRTTQDAACRLL